MIAGPEAVKAASNWLSLSRWERAELGRTLRRAGWTYGEIMELLPVGKGTLAGWCKEIRLSQVQIQAIKGRRPPGVRTGIPVDTQRKRRAEIEELKRQASTEAHALLADPFWIAGVVLYWAEGSKTKRRLELTNSDDRALRLFIVWTRKYLLPGAEFVLSLHLHEGNDDAFARSYWASRLGLERPQFYPTFVKPAGTGHRNNKLLQGVCCVSVRKSTDAFYRTMSWIENVAQLYAPIAPLSSIRVAGAIGSATDS